MRRCRRTISVPEYCLIQKRRSAAIQPVVTCAGQHGTDHGLHPGAFMYVKKGSAHMSNQENGTHDKIGMMQMAVYAARMVSIRILVTY